MSWPRYARIESEYCDVPGCDRERSANRSRWCTAHRWRVIRHGDVMAHIPVGRSRAGWGPARRTSKHFDLEDSGDL